MKEMKVNLKRLVLALGMLGATLVFANAQAVVIGAPDSGGNCFPFGCAQGTRYQQVYNDTAFGGPITIGEIRFFLNGGSNLVAGTYNFSLSHSANSVDALDTVNMGNNVGTDNTVFGSFVLGGAAPAVLSFVGASFVYDAVGDLLLDIQISGGTGGSAYFDARNGDAGGVFSRAHNFGSGFTGYGLVTEFVASVDAPPPITSVPEPASLALLGIGLAGLGAMRRKQRA